MLFIAYLRAAVLAGVFFVSCLLGGHALLVRVLRRTLPFEEHLALALALGVFAFFLEACLFGFLKLYGLSFFVLAPLMLLAAGARDARRTFARLRRHLGRVDWRPRGARSWSIAALGGVGLLLLWFPLLSPLNASYDARWYHLSIAENYVARGGITPFSEGWVHGAFPQLSSLLYAWAFSQPGTLLDRVETAAHLELAVFVMTLVGVVAVTRRVLGSRAPLAWAAVFLFPGLFCYDSGLVLGADHVAALWAAPILLLALRCAESGASRYAVLLGAMLAATLNTKYTSVIQLPLVLVVLIAAGSSRPRARLGLLAVVLVTTLLLTTPTWLKNALFYRDPLFPLSRSFLPSTPWTPAAEIPYAFEYALNRPSASVASVLEMLKTLATFSFVPHDFAPYHGSVPVFGSLFTLATPALLVVPKRPRLLALFAGTYLGIAVWFWLHQFDRYLQALLPFMAAGTAAVITLLYRRGVAWRRGVSALVALQAAWALAVPFLWVHRGAGGKIFEIVAAHLVSSDGRTAYPEWEAMGRALPEGARVLVHEEPIHTGLSRATLSDYPGDQGAFYWGEPGAAAPGEVWQRLHAHGVTHLLFARGVDHGAHTVAGGLAFIEFAARHTRSVGTFAGFSLAELGAEPPPAVPEREVAYYPCAADAIAAPGLYPLVALARRREDQRPAAAPLEASLAAALDRAHFLVFDSRCHGRLPKTAREQFDLLAARGHAMLLARKETR